MHISDSHPRKASLDLRHRLTDGLDKGFVASAGLIAHGRGEAFDYLLGEKTSLQAKEAERAASAMLLAAKKPVISVNGNVAALCPNNVVKLAKAVGARLEVNLYYRTREREEKIRDVLKKAGARKVWGVGVNIRTVPGLDSERAKSDKAILEADVVLVMLEDGDRTEYLKKMGKKVVAVDLNPLSRTAKTADITIVDNVARAVPKMTAYAKGFGKLDSKRLNAIVEAFDNRENLKRMEASVRKGV
ncbi:MAG: phosphopantothenate/pantothenate synthetase [Candidatus Altiarchaeota archaeon]